ncbi:uncharacterized protein TNCV_3369271 [Trichonephila clavipes]|uniref:Uncharacterized protein n=1 Tax=Trichonephila clavipes TaxID=2585209 RepID=A0A8X6RCZ9_TRICX|nr:uncharacterized protein TNCV_3369271 [Trichonephila clavipes]
MRRSFSSNLRTGFVIHGYENAVSGRATSDLPSLYDELESKIRALECLGRKEKYGDFLSSLVEYCLPEEILIAWERFRNLNKATDARQTFPGKIT